MLKSALIHIVRRISNQFAELEKAAFDERLGQADRIISHAGMGTIAMALESRKPVLVMPRLERTR